ncbi:hypothetical protein FE257_010480 [Aspergillus nanangensis]|uniref:Azaphilone pigments biosynthesis cluster protein L N-terminal domain-containing protein n=1 Tax=Aspergillus nanangensis TaxID=2582783 RepID=A0AAD4CIK8_ASPNN|nr:hypothetical protein FE257_010480 [Aspergillus nanangensis]
MVEPLSITASVLAVITAAVQSTKSLCDTLKRFKGRDKTLRRLQDELQDLTNILDSLAQVTKAEMSMVALLQGPIDRCNQICRDFEQSMKAFSGKSTTGLRDWAKMEFMRGDINEFIDTIAGHSSKVSQKVLQEYNEMIQDTAYNLEVHLQRIDEKMTRFTIQDIDASDIDINLEDEREVTKQCLRICEDARSFIESLTARESAILGETVKSGAENDTQSRFEAQLLTRQALDKNRDGFAEIVGRLQERLESVVLNGDRSDKERLGLQEDIQISKQCLEVCKMASEASRQKIYRIGEVVADGDSDQVVVTTLADLFDIKKALSKGNSAQLVGSMTEEALRHLAEKRYSSRFGALAPAPTEVVATSSPSVFETPKGRLLGTDYEEQSAGLKTRHNRPSPNEMRKRAIMMNNDSRDVKQLHGTADGGTTLDRRIQNRTNVFEYITADEDVFQLIGSSNGQTIIAKSVSAKAYATQCFGDVSDSTFQQVSKDRRRNTEQREIEAQQGTRFELHGPGRKLDGTSQI